MSEQEQERPLTRRELRMREQAAQESAAQDESTPEVEIEASEEASIEAAVDREIEISPLNEDGSVRTRRELRALREAALAELLDEQGDADEEVAEAEEVVEAAAEEAVSEDAEPFEDAEPSDDSGLTEDEELSENSDNVDVADFLHDVDDSYGAPTEAFSIEEILEAAQPVAPTGDADAVAALFAENEGDEDGADAEGSVLSFDLDEAGDDSGEAEDLGAEVDDFDADELEDVPAGDGVADSDSDSTVEDRADEADEELAVEEDEHVEASGEVEDVVDPAEANDADADEAESATGAEDFPAGYSFPDIQPPEEWRSVFDDPSRLTSLKTQGGTGDFDDLISRAVAQEGSTGSTGVSALILPSHPGDTGGLSGPLGVTGELFVTGSIELPKSLGETGGHAALLDSVESDQFLTGEPTSVMDAAPDAGPTPVSALSAVSARRRPEVPVVAEPTKDKSKMPIILALSGGGLLIILAGAVILAATQGWFA